MGQLVSVSFCQEISSIWKRKMPEIDPAIVEIFVVFDEISVHFPIDFVISSNTINNERTRYAIIFLKRTLQRFASKTLQKDCK